MSAQPVLSVRDLAVDYVTEQGLVRAIEDVSLDVRPGETLGIVGESGSGKTTLAQSILRVLPPPAIISSGRVLLEGRDVLEMDEDAMREVRWSRASMVFQSAMDSLNPVMPVGDQIADVITTHGDLSSPGAHRRAAELLEMVGIDARRARSYAHELSGGMRQRVGIAIALALDPALVILDEPTTALDVLVEREILGEIRALQKERGFAVLFITHDLARVLSVSDRVAVFYAARLVEIGPTSAVRGSPKHPYTRGLLDAFPTLALDSKEPVSIPGSPPSLSRPPSGCRFHPRCPLAEARCRREVPELRELAPGHRAACHLAD